MAAVFPVKCIERHPTRKTYQFVGVPISLTLISRSYDPPLPFTLISDIFTGRRGLDRITIAQGQLIAGALGMDFSAFCAELGRANYRKCDPVPRDTNSTIRGLPYR